VGGGLCGLATTFHLLRRNCDVVVYDGAMDRGVPVASRFATGDFYATASAVAAGLLHPLTPKLKEAWAAEAATLAANELLAAAARFDDGIVSTDVILRPARDAADAVFLRDAAAALPARLRWLEAGDFRAAARGYDDLEAEFGGVWLLDGKVVDAKRYLRALWAACAAQGAHWRHTAVDDPKALLGVHDRVVFCGGAKGSSSFAANAVPTTLTRGQSAIFRRRRDDALPALLRGHYVAPLSREGAVVLGATREQLDSYEEAAPDAMDRLLDPRERRRLGAAADVFGLLRGGGFDPVASTAAVRLDGPRTPHGKLPFVHVDGDDPRFVTAGALGARGLLRHAQVGRLAATLATSSSLVFSSEGGDEEELRLLLRPS